MNMPPEALAAAHVLPPAVMDAPYCRRCQGSGIEPSRCYWCNDVADVYWSQDRWQCRDPDICRNRCRTSVSAPHVRLKDGGDPP